MRAIGRRGWVRVGAAVATIAAALAVATVLVALLEVGLDVPDASATYLLAVVLVAITFGSAAAVATAIGAFLVYNYLFIEPTGTLVVAEAREWLNLLLLLVLGLTVGELAGLQRRRADAALLRERQARALYRISRSLATTASATGAMPEIVDALMTETRAERAWVSLADASGQERTAADSDSSAQPTVPASHHVLNRRPGDEPADWVRVHDPRHAGGTGGTQTLDVFRVPIVVAGSGRGSVWISRTRAAGRPGRGDTRVLAAAADQIGQALERDRLADEALSAAVARRSEAAKTALLDSVSHDLRTPLAAIRAAAGSLADPQVPLSDAERRQQAAAIDRDAERLNRLVTNLLDLSRIEAGDLHGTPAIFVLADLVVDAVARHGAVAGDRPIEVDVPDDLPPVEVDAVFIGQVLANLLENATEHTPPGTAVRVAATDAGPGRVRLTVEDAGAGVPADALPRLFERFYRGPQSGRSRSRGTGVGLAVVRGLTEAMGGTVRARRSELGGLAVDLDLPAAAAPPADEDEPGSAS